MATESCSKASEDSMPPPSSATKQRRKRKWDQPAESFISAAGLAAVAAPGAVPLSLGDGLVGTSLGCGLPPGPVPAACAAVTAAAAIVQKLNQPKTPVELIAREIVINDADPTIRYRLTKRQTQEEIQKTTGAVVITRGKYRPPSAMPDNEKPLYLHISSGAHLKDTTERIKAVDRAASMVEGILKQGQNSQSGPATSCGMLNTGGLVKQPLSTCVFLGFVPDVSLNIAERIRGPNDQYISHIMNVTGATVVLRGRGVENSESIVTDGYPRVEHTMQFLLHSSCWLVFRARQMNIRQMTFLLLAQHVSLSVLHQTSLVHLHLSFLQELICTLQGQH